MRHAFIGHLRTERRAEYLRLHQAVWPEVLALISATGITDYTIWNHGDLLFATYVFNGPDHDQRIAAMVATPVMQRWWAECVPCFSTIEAGTPWVPLTQVFRLG